MSKATALCICRFFINGKVYEAFVDVCNTGKEYEAFVDGFINGKEYETFVDACINGKEYACIIGKEYAFGFINGREYETFVDACINCKEYAFVDALSMPSSKARSMRCVDGFIHGKEYKAFVHGFVDSRGTCHGGIEGGFELNFQMICTSRKLWWAVSLSCRRLNRWLSACSSHQSSRRLGVSWAEYAFQIS